MQRKQTSFSRNLSIAAAGAGALFGISRANAQNNAAALENIFKADQVTIAADYFPTAKDLRTQEGFLISMPEEQAYLILKEAILRVDDLPLNALLTEVYAVAYQAFPHYRIPPLQVIERAATDKTMSLAVKLADEDEIAGLHPYLAKLSQGLDDNALAPETPFVLFTFEADDVELTRQDGVYYLSQIENLKPAGKTPVQTRQAILRADAALAKARQNNFPSRLAADHGQPIILHQPRIMVQQIVPPSLAEDKARPASQPQAQAAPAPHQPPPAAPNTAPDAAPSEKNWIGWLIGGLTAAALAAWNLTLSRKLRRLRLSYEDLLKEHKTANATLQEVQKSTGALRKDLDDMKENVSYKRKKKPSSSNGSHHHNNNGHHSSPPRGPRGRFVRKEGSAAEESLSSSLDKGVQTAIEEAENARHSTKRHSPVIPSRSPSPPLKAAPDVCACIAEPVSFTNGAGRSRKKAPAIDIENAVFISGAYLPAMLMRLRRCR